MFPAASNAFAGEYQSRLLAPLQRLSPVTDAMLADPPPQEWLMWRRTYDGWGFSPLRQITRKNVEALNAETGDLLWRYDHGRNRVRGGPSRVPCREG